MKNSQIKSIVRAVFAGSLLTILSSAAFANNTFTLENLERERATLLKTLTDSSLNSYQRQSQSENIYRRMIDAERMVLRDERLSQSQSVLAKKAFADYGLTFLVHASAETKKRVLEHWLDELNLSTKQIQNTKVGFK